LDGAWMSAMAGSAIKIVFAGCDSRMVWPRETLRRICPRSTATAAVVVSCIAGLRKGTIRTAGCSAANVSLLEAARNTQSNNALEGRRFITTYCRPFRDSRFTGIS
jgi:hypothetical protein